ncbi:MAG: NusG domain II-containing protein [Oscillospiraceae bacterium]|nr:NusG domain II-containing protein [Oscillospiraceae bacterium]MBR5251297.1 NusG domain II-containing protein [Oscillospiraceae bacterium]
MKKFLNINTILIGIVLIAGIAGILFMNANKTEGSKAIVDIHFDGKEERMEIDLSVDETYHIETTLPVTLVVKDGKIHFENSQCPDHLCEGFGEIYFDNQSASCLPAGVIVTIDEAVK